MRKQTGLHLFGDCQLARSVALRFQPSGLSTALCFQGARCLIELNQRKTVSIRIFKNRVPRLPVSPGRFGSGKWTPRLDHSSNKLRTSSVRKLNPVLWPMRWCSTDPSGGTTRPSRAGQRLPFQGANRQPADRQRSIGRPREFARPQSPRNLSFPRRTAGSAPDHGPKASQSLSGEKAARVPLGVPLRGDQTLPRDALSVPSTDYSIESE